MRSAVLQLIVVAAVVNGAHAAGCDCLNVTWPAAMLNSKHFALNYGTSCAAWEDGDSASHAVGNLTSCHAMWPEEVVGDWCCQPWCYVNKTTCPSALASWVDPSAAEPLYYSYEDACPAASTTTKWSDATCPWGECECTGTGWGAEVIQHAGFSMEYGTYCAAWEDGNCGETNTTTGVHTCGTNAECDEMWWKNDNTSKIASGDWCCQSWCYIGAACPLPDVANSSLNTANSSEKLVYSYNTCARASTPVKFTDEQCPFTPDHDERPGGYQCACSGSTFSAANLATLGFPSTYGTSCEAWEDGNCNATAVDGHVCGTNTDCNSMWPTEPKGDWCCKPWCYVDPECDLADVAPSMLNEDFDGADFSLSYAACEFDVEEEAITYDDGECPFEVDLTANPCACLHVTYNEEILTARGMPPDYGQYCAAWDDGDGDSHSLGTTASCHELWPGLAVSDWCCQAWCYVDASCPDAQPAWANDQNDVPLYYSYTAACDDADGPGMDAATKYTDATCPWGDCDCVGAGNGWPAAVTTDIQFAAEYGTYCAAWEDGNCGAMDEETGSHECGDRKECDEMWWKNPQTDEVASGDWCCQAWCYVGPLCPLPDVSDSWLNPDDPSGVSLKYSYNTCERADPPLLYTVDVTATDGTVTEGTCPFTPADDARPGGWRCACIGETFAENELNGIGFSTEYGSSCAAWEDGDCSAHTCGTNSDCRAMWPALEKDAWCCQPWCWVDKELCTLEDVVDSALNADFAKNLAFSYQACDVPVVDNAIKYKTEAECPWNFDFTENPCECIQQTWATDNLLDRGFMRDYGTFCASWEDGDESRHAVGANPSCHTMWPELDVSRSGWCCAPWCYVNPETCPDAEPSWLNGNTLRTTDPPLYYSYVAACGDLEASAAAMETEVEYTSGTCPWLDCKCTGEGQLPNDMEEIGFPRQYGQWCAAWEDGDCDNFATTDTGDGHHPCGTNFECPQMYALNGLTIERESGDWCCEPWCYVGSRCPLEKVQHVILKETTSTGEAPPSRLLSYDSCRRQFFDDINREATYTVGDDGTCPFDADSDVEGALDVEADTSFVQMVVLTLRMPLESVEDFTTDKRLRFRRAMARASGKKLGKIKFLSVVFFSDERRGGRTLLATGVDVETAIGADSEADADALADSDGLKIDNINRELENQGLPRADLAEAPRAVYDGDNDFSGGAIAGMVIGILAGVLLFAYFTCFRNFMSPKSPEPNTRDVPIAVDATKADVAFVPEPVGEPEQPAPMMSAAPIVFPPAPFPMMPMQMPMQMPMPMDPMSPMGSMPMQMMGSMPPMAGMMGSMPPMGMGSMPPAMGMGGGNSMQMPTMMGSTPPMGMGGGGMMPMGM